MRSAQSSGTPSSPENPGCRDVCTFVCSMVLVITYSPLSREFRRRLNRLRESALRPHHPVNRTSIRSIQAKIWTWSRPAATSRGVKNVLYV